MIALILVFAFYRCFVYGFCRRRRLAQLAAAERNRPPAWAENGLSSVSGDARSVPEMMSAETPEPKLSHKAISATTTNTSTPTSPSTTSSRVPSTSKVVQLADVSQIQLAELGAHQQQMWRAGLSHRVPSFSRVRVDPSACRPRASPHSGQAHDETPGTARVLLRRSFSIGHAPVGNGQGTSPGTSPGTSVESSRLGAVRMGDRVLAIRCGEILSPTFDLGEILTQDSTSAPSRLDGGIGGAPPAASSSSIDASLQAAFRYIDVDKSGTVSKEQLERALKHWGFICEDRQNDPSIQAVLHACTASASGSIDYDEFKSAFSQSIPPPTPPPPPPPPPPRRSRPSSPQGPLKDQPSCAPPPAPPPRRSRCMSAAPSAAAPAATPGIVAVARRRFEASTATHAATTTSEVPYSEEPPPPPPSRRNRCLRASASHQVEEEGAATSQLSSHSSHGPSTSPSTTCSTSPSERYERDDACLADAIAHALRVDKRGVRAGIGTVHTFTRAIAYVADAHPQWALVSCTPKFMVTGGIEKALLDVSEGRYVLSMSYDVPAMSSEELQRYHLQDFAAFAGTKQYRRVFYGAGLEWVRQAHQDLGIVHDLGIPTTASTASMIGALSAQHDELASSSRGVLKDDRCNAPVRLATDADRASTEAARAFFQEPYVLPMRIDEVYELVLRSPSRAGVRAITKQITKQVSFGARAPRDSMV